MKPKVHKYANGGAVHKDARKKVKKPKPEMLGTGTASRAGQAVSGRKKQIEDALKAAGA